jgi:hypothetical protein
MKTVFCYQWISPASERTRSKEGNTYLDVQELISHVGEVSFVQLSVEKWLDPFIAALKAYPEASRHLEIRFKNSTSHTYLYKLRTDDFNMEYIILGNAVSK